VVLVVPVAAVVDMVAPIPILIVRLLYDIETEHYYILMVLCLYIVIYMQYRYLSHAYYSTLNCLSIYRMFLYNR
jgi:hypothetical protein